MKRHELDIFSLIAGLTFTGIAVVYLIASLNDRSVNGRIVIPVALISLGTAGLAGAVARMARRNRAAADAASGNPAADDGTGERSLADLAAELDAMDAASGDTPRTRKAGPPAA